MAAGDAVILLLFAAIGRTAHHEGGAVVGTVEVALPFLIGWFAAAWAQGAYRVEAFSDVATSFTLTTRTWLAGGIIGLIIRSVVERHLAPFTFVLIALGFNLVLLCAWRTAVTLAWNLRRT